MKKFTTVIAFILFIAQIIALAIGIKMAKPEAPTVNPTPQVSHRYAIATIYEQNAFETVFEDEDGNLWAVTNKQYSEKDLFMLIFNEADEITKIWIQG